MFILNQFLPAQMPSVEITGTTIWERGVGLTTETFKKNTQFFGKAIEMQATPEVASEERENTFRLTSETAKPRPISKKIESTGKN